MLYQKFSLETSFYILLRNIFDSRNSCRTEFRFTGIIVQGISHTAEPPSELMHYFPSRLDRKNFPPKPTLAK